MSYFFYTSICLVNEKKHLNFLLCLFVLNNTFSIKMNLPSFQVCNNLTTSFAGCCHFIKKVDCSVEWFYFINKSETFKCLYYNCTAWYGLSLCITLFNINSRNIRSLTHLSVSQIQLVTNRGSNTMAFVNVFMRQAEAVSVRPGKTHLALGGIWGRCSNKKAAPTEHAPIQAETEREWTYCRSWPLRSFGSDHQ